MTLESLPKVKGATLLVDRAHRELERAILDHRIPPGTPLSVPKLAEQLGISRSPVREAVLRLTAVGLAVNVPHKGAVVAEIAVEDFSDLFEVREPLEGVAARRAAANATAEDLAGLRSILAQHEKVVGGDDVDCQVELDMRFHQRIRDIAANAELSASLDRIQMRSHHALNTLWRGGTSRHSLDRHYEIFNAIEAGDGAAAEAAARIHIAEVRARIVEVLQSSDNGKVPA